MTEAKETKGYSLRKDQRSHVLAKYGVELEHTGKLQDYVVQEGESRILTYKNEGLRPLYRKIQPGSVDELKDILGIPSIDSRSSKADALDREGLGETEPHEQLYFTPAMPSRLDIGRLQSRVISPQLLSSNDISQDERQELMAMARMATEAYIYGDSNQVLQWKATINEYLQLKNALVFIPYFKDIIVHHNGTLTVAADTHAVYARRIRLYGRGRIICEGPTTFDCFSFEGLL